MSCWYPGAAHNSRSLLTYILTYWKQLELEEAQF